MIKLKKHYMFECDDCNFITFFNNFSIARAKGWAIARDRKKCYCEICAKYHRYVGSAGTAERTKDEAIKERFNF